MDYSIREQAYESYRSECEAADREREARDREEKEEFYREYADSVAQNAVETHDTIVKTMMGKDYGKFFHEPEEVERVRDEQYWDYKRDE